MEYRASVILVSKGSVVMKLLQESFYRRQCLPVAEDLIGKWLVRRLPSGEVRRLQITETEAYCGEEDTACHAHKGRTPRTEVMYAKGGTIYIYLCYGMHWMLNIVTGEEEHPQAVLIRACDGASGPGKLTKALSVTGELNRKSILGEELWIEDDGAAYRVTADKRVGIGYASQEDQDRLWRFKLA